MTKNKHKTHRNLPKENKTGLKDQPKEKMTGTKVLGNDPFNWEIDDEYYKKQKDCRFFGKNTLPVLRMLEASKLPWEEIGKRPNTHPFNVSEISWRYQETLKSLCHRKKIDYGAFYQMPGKASGAHRIVGYREKGVFYLVMDDEEHGMFPN